MAIKITLICLSMFLWVPMLAQTSGSDTTVRPISNKQKVSGHKELLSRLGNVRLIFKDGSIRKNCKVKEIHSYWIVYEKGGSLHDALIEKILRIEITETQAVLFDQENKPRLIR